MITTPAISNLVIAPGAPSSPTLRTDATRGIANSFAEVLAGQEPEALTGRQHTVKEEDPDPREVAAQFVALVFVAPILADLREGPFQVEGPFAATDAQKRFGPMYDALIADRITSAANFSLVDDIAERLTRNRGGVPGPMGAGKGEGRHD